MMKNLPNEYIKFINDCRVKVNSGEQIHRHHIIPKFMGGNDEADNLIELSVEDHFEAHRILAENVDDKYKTAAWSSLNVLKKYWNGNYEEIRKSISNALSGEANGMYGKTHSKEYIEQLRKQYKGKGNPFYGKTHSAEVRTRMSKNHADFSGGCNPSAKKCIDAHTGKIYECISDMAIDIQKPRTTVNRWVKSEKNKRFNYIK